MAVDWLVPSFGLRHEGVRAMVNLDGGDAVLPGASGTDFGQFDAIRNIVPLLPAHDAFVFTTPAGTPIDAVNFQTREWRRALAALKIRPRPFYNTRHTYKTHSESSKGLCAGRARGDRTRLLRHPEGSGPQIEHLRVFTPWIDGSLIDPGAPEIAGGRVHAQV